MHGMVSQFMLKKDFLLHGTYLRKLCRFLLMFSTGFTSLSVLLLFPLSVIDEVLSINPSAVFVFGDFNVHHKD